MSSHIPPQHPCPSSYSSENGVALGNSASFNRVTPFGNHPLCRELPWRPGSSWPAIGSLHHSRMLQLSPTSRFRDSTMIVPYSSSWIYTQSRHAVGAVNAWRAMFFFLFRNSRFQRHCTNRKEKGRSEKINTAKRENKLKFLCDK